MAQPIRQVLYPEVDFNDTRPYAFALTYDKVREGTGHLVLHSHKTGLIGMQVSGGYFGVELASEHMAVPVNTAVWVPPDVPHCTTQCHSCTSICLHVAPEVAKAFLPDHPVRCVVNSLTREMIRHFARVWLTTERSLTARRLASFIVQELKESPLVTDDFAPLPQNAILRDIAFQLVYNPGSTKTLAEWAAVFAVGEKTLARITLKETGMSFARWAMHFRLLPAMRALFDGVSVEEAAGIAGFQTTAAFINAFTRVFGVTPGKWRDTEQGNGPWLTPATNFPRD